MKVTAYLTYSVNVTCPECKKEFDLIENNDVDGAISVPLFNNKWGDVYGVDVECDHCEHEFELDSMEY